MVLSGDGLKGLIRTSNVSESFWDQENSKIMVILESAEKWYRFRETNAPKMTYSTG